MTRSCSTEEGAITQVTRKLSQHWTDSDRDRENNLFFCQIQFDEGMLCQDS